jgi:hypothetical protein
MNTGNNLIKTYGAVKGKGPLCLFLSANLTPVGLSGRVKSLGGEMCQNSTALFTKSSTSSMKAQSGSHSGKISPSSSPATPNIGGAKRISALIIIAIIGFFMMTGMGEAMEYPKNLWKGLIAEACNQGYDGMYAVACCVRNRIDAGMNTGLCALKRKDLDAFCKKQGRLYEVMAKDIITKVFEQNGVDTTFGATHYENIKAYGLPRWAVDMAITVKIKDHTFFREVRQ